MTAAVEGLHRPAGSTARDGWSVLVTPERAGWGFTGLRIGDLGPGERITLETGDDETVVLPLAGAGHIETAGDDIQLEGRADPFSGPTDFAYLPPDTVAVVEFSRCPAPVRGRDCEDRQPRRAPRGPGDPPRCRRGRPDRAPRGRAVVPARPQLRGPGRARRRAADRRRGHHAWWQLVVVAAHKHDEDRPGEAVLEEIYYYEIRGGPAGPGLAYQRVYGAPDRPLDLLVEVRDGDVVLIPHGWHGPSMAAPGYDLYYLNVMAGPGDEREWRITDDPAHAWVRGTWAGQTVDPRLTAAATAPTDGTER